MTFGEPQPPFVPRSPEPDWNALAERHAVDGRVRRMLWISAGAVAAALVLGGVLGWAVAGSGSTTTKVATKPSHSAAPGVSDLAARLLDDSVGAGVGAPSGSAPLGVGLAASVAPVQTATGSVGHPSLGDHALWGVGDPSSYAATAARVVDTDHSFTVSAWVLNQATTDGRSAVSQGDGGYFGFDLGRDFWPQHNEWTFKVQTAAGNQDSTVHAVYSKADANVGQWVQLLGSYDAQSHTISLWVDGQLQETAPVTGVYSEPGPLQLGRLTVQNRWADHWYGQIAKVQLWNAALTPADAAKTPSTHAWLMS